MGQMSHSNSEEQFTIETLKGAITIIVEHKSGFIFYVQLYAGCDQAMCGLMLPTVTCHTQ